MPLPSASAAINRVAAFGVVVDAEMAGRRYQAVLSARALLHEFWTLVLGARVHGLEQIGGAAAQGGRGVLCRRCGVIVYRR